MLHLLLFFHPLSSFSFMIYCLRKIKWLKENLINKPNVDTSCGSAALDVASLRLGVDLLLEPSGVSSTKKRWLKYSLRIWNTSRTVFFPRKRSFNLQATSTNTLSPPRRLYAAGSTLQYNYKKREICFVSLQRKSNRFEIASNIFWWTQHASL